MRKEKDNEMKQFIKKHKFYFYVKLLMFYRRETSRDSLFNVHVKYFLSRAKKGNGERFVIKIAKSFRGTEQIYTVRHDLEHSSLAI